MIHGPDQAHHTERVQGRFLAAEVRVPEVRDVPWDASNSLIMEPSAALPMRLEVMNPGERCLRHLVRQHVAVVVVRGHPEAALGPPDDLHRGRVADECAARRRTFEEPALRYSSL